MIAHPFTAPSDTAHYHNCFNCHSPLPESVVYIPIQKNSHGEYTFDNIPFCSTACALRYNLEKPVNTNSAVYMYEYYGIHILAAPPREMLFTATGMSLEQYRNQTASGTMIIPDSTHVRHTTKRAYSVCTVPLASTSTAGDTSNDRKHQELHTNSMDFLNQIPMKI